MGNQLQTTLGTGILALIGLISLEMVSDFFASVEPTWEWFLVIVILWIIAAYLLSSANKSTTQNKSKTRRLSKRELKEWKKVDPLKLGDSACIWFEISPQNPIVHNKAKFAELSSAITNREVRRAIFSWPEAMKDATQPITVETYKPDYDTLISRSSLQRYAKQTGDIPRFLE